MEEYINTELLLVIPALYGFGEILKREKICESRFIPFILTLLSVVCCVVYCWDFTAKGFVSGIVQGLLCVSSAVYGNQVYKQWKQK